MARLRRQVGTCDKKYPPIGLREAVLRAISNPNFTRHHQRIPLQESVRQWKVGINCTKEQWAELEKLVTEGR